MTCVVCGAQHRSQPEVESDWRAIEVDGKILYACPKEFPPNGAGKEKFRMAYQIVLACCLNEVTKASGGNSLPLIEKIRWHAAHRPNRQPKGFGK